MKNKILFAFFFTFMVGILLQILTSSRLGTDTSYNIGYLFGGGLAMLLMTPVIPIIVSLIVFAIKKKFPGNLFVILIYVVLIIMTVMLVGQMAVKSWKTN